jgi:anti-sigma B factor antagonist
VSQASEISAPDRSIAGPPFQCAVSPNGQNAAWVHVAGELDLLTAPQLDRALREAQTQARLVVLDAREVTFIDSAGIHVVEAASKHSERGGARLLVATGPVLDRMLALTGVAQQISTFELSPTEQRPDGASPRADP